MAAVPTDLKVFIKDEPTKVSKLGKRERIVWILSLVDQMVDRWLFYDIIREDIQNYHKVASKTGWSPMPEGLLEFNQAFPPGMTVMAMDSSSFDWTVNAWELEELKRAWRMQLRVCPPGYWNAVTMRIDEVLGCQCSVRLPTGQRLQQRRPGIMKSGFLLTLKMNSDLQLLVNFTALKIMLKQLPPQLPTLWAMGDDVLLEWDSSWDVAEYVAVLTRLGLVVKQTSHEREFAGFKFPGGTVVEPAYPAKHMFKLQYNSTQEMVDAMSLQYALSNHYLAHWLRLRQTVHPELMRGWALGLVKLDWLA